MVHVGPGTVKNRRSQCAPVLNRSRASIHTFERLQECTIELHCHENGYPVQGDVHTRIPEVERIIGSFHRTHVDVHPLDRLVRCIVNGMRMAHAADSACPALENGCSSVDCELSFAIEDHEHFFALIMEMMTDPTLWVDYSSVEEEQVGI